MARRRGTRTVVRSNEVRPHTWLGRANSALRGHEGRNSVGQRIHISRAWARGLIVRHDCIVDRPHT